MPRSNWKGTITFGLVSIPVELYNSENVTERILFHQMDKRDKARIKYQRVNAKTGKEVPWEDIIKGYAYDKETTIPVAEDELKRVAGENARTIAIENFVKKENIDFIDISKTYYLVPEKKGEKGYVILREALRKSNVIGIAKVIISTKEYIAAVACYKNALVLYLLRYHEEIRPLSEFNIPAENVKEYGVNNKEIDAALLLIKAMTEKWKPNKYKDEYQAAVHKWAENKIKHKSAFVMQKRAAETPPKNADFIALLKKSLMTKNNKKPKTKLAIPHVKKKSINGRRATLH